MWHNRIVKYEVHAVQYKKDPLKLVVGENGQKDGLPVVSIQFDVFS